MKPIKYSFCRSSFVYNNIQNYRKNHLIIDTRDFDSFNASSLAGSINLNKDRVQRYLEANLNTLDINQLTMANIGSILDQDETGKWNERKRRFCMLIISENSMIPELLSEIINLTESDDTVDGFTISEDKFNDTLRALIERVQEEHDSVALGLKLFKLLHRDRVSDVHVMIEGASQFFTRYSFMNNANADVFVGNGSLPHDILNGKLYLGNFNQAKNLDLVKKLKITKIVNSACECENQHIDAGVNYLKLDLDDECPEDKASPFFKKVFEFMEEIVNHESDQVVLVHCAMGKSRSATMVIMFLMKKFKWSYDKAYEYVKERRNLVRPYCGFVHELEAFERREHAFETPVEVEEPVN